MTVDGWDFNNKFLLAMGISNEIAIALDESATQVQIHIYCLVLGILGLKLVPAGLDGEWNIGKYYTRRC